MTLVLLAFAGLGLSFGSFLNVCIVRLPAGESIVAPRSKCPRCGTPIAWYDNIPLLSWLVLRGRCRGCQLPISVQYPLIEAATGVIWILSALLYGLSLRAVAGGVFGTILLGAAIMDARHESIPEQYSVAGLVIGLLLGLGSGFDGLQTAVLGAVAGFVILYAVERVGDHFFGDGAIGGAHSRMMAMIGAFLGWPGAMLVVLGAGLLGGVFSAVFALSHRRVVPFGVFLALAAGAVFVVGDAISVWYLNFLRAG